MDAHSGGLLAVVVPAAGRPAGGVQRDPGVPADPGCRGRAVVERVRAGARAPLSLVEAVGGTALLRAPRAAGAHPPRCGAGGPVRTLDLPDTRMGAVRAAAVLG